MTNQLVVFAFDKSASTKVSTKPYRTSGAGLRLARGTDHFNREDPVSEVYDVSRFVFFKLACFEPRPN